MHKRLLLSVAVAAAFTVSLLPGYAAGQTHHPGVGQWKLNVAKSQFLLAPPRSQTLWILPDGDSIKVTLDTVNPIGVATSTTYVARYDGKDYPFPGNPDADTVSLKRVNERVVQLTSKKGGQIVTTSTREVSPDGKTLTTHPQIRSSLVFTLTKGPSGKTADPLIGTWELNLEKSRIAGPQPRRQTVHFEPDGRGIKSVFESVNAAGVATKSEFTASYDGKDYPIKGANPGATVALQRVGSHAIRQTNKRSGDIVATQTRRVSQDGKTMTADVVAHNRNVYEKQR